MFKLHLAIFGSFLGGCAAGPSLLHHVGTVRWLVVPLGLLIALMVFDLTLGIGKQSAPPPAQPAAGMGPT